MPSSLLLLALAGGYIITILGAHWSGRVIGHHQERTEQAEGASEAIAKAVREASERAAANAEAGRLAAENLAAERRRLAAIIGTLHAPSSGIACPFNGDRMRDGYAAIFPAESVPPSPGRFDR